MSPPQFPLLPPTAPFPLSLKVPVGPDVFDVTFLDVPSLSLKVPEVITDPEIVFEPAVPAVLLLKGPCTPPPEAEAPPPPFNVNKLPVVDPDKVVLVPPLALPL